MEENKCAVCTINVYFYTINVVYMVCGITFVILGILMELIPSVHHEILSAELVIPPIILITVGALMLVVSFIGYCGSRIDHYCMLVTYVCLAIFFLLFTIGAAVALLVFPVHITDAIKNQMKTEQETYSTSASSRRYWDKFHSMFQCCGIYNTSEWLEIQKYIPISCCQPIPDDDDEEEDSHCKSKNKRKPFLREIGCLQRLDSAYLRYSIIIMVCSIIACIIQTFCLSFACFIMNREKENDRQFRSNCCCCGNGYNFNNGFNFNRNNTATSTDTFSRSTSRSRHDKFSPMGNNMNYGVLNSAFRVEYVPLDVPQKPLTFLPA